MHGTYRRSKWKQNMIFLIILLSQTTQIHTMISSPTTRLLRSPITLYPSLISPITLQVSLWRDNHQIQSNIHHSGISRQHQNPLQLQPYRQPQGLNQTPTPYYPIIHWDAPKTHRFSPEKKHRTLLYPKTFPLPPIWAQSKNPWVPLP